MQQHQKQQQSSPPRTDAGAGAVALEGKEGRGRQLLPGAGKPQSGSDTSAPPGRERGVVRKRASSPTAGKPPGEGALYYGKRASPELKAANGDLLPLRSVSPAGSARGPRGRPSNALTARASK